MTNDKIARLRPLPPAKANILKPMAINNGPDLAQCLLDHLIGVIMLKITKNLFAVFFTFFALMGAAEAKVCFRFGNNCRHTIAVGEDYAYDVPNSQLDSFLESRRQRSHSRVQNDVRYNEETRDDLYFTHTQSIWLPGLKQSVYFQYESILENKFTLEELTNGVERIWSAGDPNKLAQLEKLTDSEKQRIADIRTILKLFCGIAQATSLGKDTLILALEQLIKPGDDWILPMLTRLKEYPLDSEQIDAIDVIAPKSN